MSSNQNKEPLETEVLHTCLSKRFSPVAGKLRKPDPVLFERARRVRLLEDLDRHQKLARGRKIRIATAPDVHSREMKDLPAGIHLKPGELRIEFFGAEDLLRHLYELSQAIVNDYARFQKAVEE